MFVIKGPKQIQIQQVSSVCSLGNTSWPIERKVAQVQINTGSS